MCAQHKKFHDQIAAKSFRLKKFQFCHVNRPKHTGSCIEMSAGTFECMNQKLNSLMKHILLSILLLEAKFSFIWGALLTNWGMGVKDFSQIST